MAQQKGFFVEYFRLEKINKQEDPHRKLDEYTDWEIFRPILKKPFVKKQNDLKVDLNLIM